MDADYLKLHTQSHRQSILERFDAAVSRAIEEAEDHDDHQLRAAPEGAVRELALMKACRREKAGRFDQSGRTIDAPQSSGSGNSYKS